MDRGEENNLGRLLLNLSNTIIRNRNRHLQALEMTGSQADSLQFLLDHPNSAINDLRAHLGVTHQTAWGIVQRLESRGWITLERSKCDRRRQIIVLTPEGVAQGERTLVNRYRTSKLLVKGMTEREREEFCRLIKIAHENVKNDWSAELYGDDQQ